ncbi:ATPase [Halobacteriales archaeon QS_1_68_17]|nr:MAG: ATPase [Halobacteriales archaeon QS_1_68_17]
METETVSRHCEAVLAEVADAVIADRDVLETILAGFLAGGHVLLEDVPGTGKTLTARSFARALGLTFSRVQFTPDMLPADVTGSHVFDETAGTFEFREGPLFADVVLADELNRASPKTQSALLEAMAEGQVTVDGETYELPDHFFVIATQNPIEQEGTFPLAAAQVDRFAVKTALDYPDEPGERELLARRADRQNRAETVDAVPTVEDIQRLRWAPEEVRVDDDVRAYIVDLARATREHGQVGTGVSPRGTERLFEVARARACIAGREYVTPSDVKRSAEPVMTHRMQLTPDARVDGVTARSIVDSILAETPVPAAVRPD